MELSGKVIIFETEEEATEWYDTIKIVMEEQKKQAELHKLNEFAERYERSQYEG